MAANEKRVVLMARVDDSDNKVTLATFSTLVQVEHNPEQSFAEIVESALEIGPAVKNWLHW